MFQPKRILLSVALLFSTGFLQASPNKAIQITFLSKSDYKKAGGGVLFVVAALCVVLKINSLYKQVGRLKESDEALRKQLIQTIQVLGYNPNDQETNKNLGSFLHEKSRGLVRENSKLIEKLDEITRENVDLEEALVQKNGKNIELKKALLQKNGKKNDLKEALLTKNDENIKLKQTLLTKNDENIELKKKLNDLNNNDTIRLDDMLKEELSLLHSNHTNLKDEYEVLKNECEVLKDTNRILKIDNKRLQLHNSKVEENEKTLNQEIDTLNQEIDTLKQRVDQLSSLDYQIDIGNQQVYYSDEINDSLPPPLIFDTVDIKEDSDKR